MKNKKGSKRRPRSIPDKEFELRWKLAFADWTLRKKKERSKLTRKKKSVRLYRQRLET